MPAENLTLTAQWELTHYTINYSDLFGSENPNPLTFTIESLGTGIVLLDPTNIPIGKIFKGWYTAEEGGVLVNEITDL